MYIVTVSQVYDVFLCVVIGSSKEMFHLSEAKARLAAQLAEKYDFRSNKQHNKPPYLNSINTVRTTVII